MVVTITVIIIITIIVYTPACLRKYQQVPKNLTLKTSPQASHLEVACLLAAHASARGCAVRNAHKFGDSRRRCRLANSIFAYGCEDEFVPSPRGT